MTLLLAPHANRCLVVVTQPGRGQKDVGAGLLRRALRESREEGEAGAETEARATLPISTHHSQQGCNISRLSSPHQETSPSFDPLT